MRTRVHSYFAPGVRQWRGVTISVPRIKVPDHLWNDDAKLEAWCEKHDEKAVLRRKLAPLVSRFKIPKRSITIRSYSCISPRAIAYIRVYTGSGTPAERARFKDIAEAATKIAKARP